MEREIYTKKSMDNPYFCIGLYHDDKDFLNKVTVNVVNSLIEQSFILMEESSFLQFSKNYLDKQSKKYIGKDTNSLRLINFKEFIDPFFVFLFIKYEGDDVISPMGISTKASNAILFSDYLESDIPLNGSLLPLSLEVRQSYFLDKEKKRVFSFVEDYYGIPFNPRKYLDELPLMPFDVY